MDNLIRLAKQDLIFYKDKNKKLKQAKAEHLTIIQLLDYQIAETEEEINDISEGIKMLKDVDDTGCKDINDNPIKVRDVINTETLEVVHPTVVRTKEEIANKIESLMEDNSNFADVGISNLTLEPIFDYLATKRTLEDFAKWMMDKNYENLECVFLIEKAWVDPMENRDSHGYDLYTYRLSEKEAKDFCDLGGYLTEKDCWSIGFEPNKRLPIYRYKKIEKR